MRVGIIGDTHFPFVHPRYLEFIRDVFETWSVERVVHIGDVVDNHATSRYTKDPDGLSAGAEGDAARECIAEWHDTLGPLHVCIGNHDTRLFGRAMEAGLPSAALRGMADIWDTPNWEWVPEIEIDGVLYTHGTGSSGKRAAIRRAQASRQSTVIGHVHSHAGVEYSACRQNVIFGMNVGCGLDITAYAMAYAKPFPVRPVLGCGVVLDGSYATFEIMDAGDKYRR